jgi:D-amino-acid dehydrogenase
MSMSGSAVVTADVAVLGGGLVGTALAYELAADGVDVVLVDCHHPGRATDAGAGILSPESTWNPDPHWFDFGMAAGRHYRSLVARLADDGAPETGFAQCGMLMVALEPGEDDWFSVCADLVQRRVPDIVTEITPDQARALFPPLGLVRRVLHNPAAARIDGRSMTAALLHGAEHHGLRRLQASATGLLTEAGRVTGVATDVGDVSSGSVAIAGGAWSPEFGRQLGLSIPVDPVKGQIIHMQLPDDPAGGVVNSGDWPIVSPVIHHYLVAWPGGRVACGGTYEPDARFDIRPTVFGLEDVLRGALALAPGLADAEVIDHRVGLRPVTPDGLPVLGPVPGWDNLQLVTGHGVEGLLLGPYSSAVVAGCLQGEPVPDELAPFSVTRFAR